MGRKGNMDLLDKSTHTLVYSEYVLFYSGYATPAERVERAVEVVSNAV